MLILTKAKKYHRKDYTELMRLHSCFILLLIALLAILLRILHGAEGGLENYADAFIKTKCFSCMRELPDGYKWLGAPVKSFSAQFESASRNPYGGYYETPEKCFDCERQVDNSKSAPSFLDYSGWRFPGSYVN